VGVVEDLDRLSLDTVREVIGAFVISLTVHFTFERVPFVC
jgi:hypothetical protein